MMRPSKLNPVAERLCLFIGIASMATAVIFVVNNFLTHGVGLPGAESLSGGGFFQAALYVGGIGAAGWLTLSRPDLMRHAGLMERLASVIVAAAFWSVLLIGIADAVLSFMRVEGLHAVIFGETLANRLGLSSWRGLYVHIPLMVVAAVISLREKSVSVVWLILMVVLAELLIVLARFIFAYEQTFMGDLVRFWYAALFLFASAYTLKEEGHVRVDVLFAAFRKRTKAWVNATGTAAFGIPLCWVVLWRGLSGKSSLINGPMLNFETSMSGFGMYVKYLMAAFLIVFALSMMAQFTAYFFTALAQLGEADGDAPDALDALDASDAPGVPDGKEA